MTFPFEVRQGMYNASGGYCQCSKECVKPITEFHHMLPNTSVNKKLYPLFLQSPFNCLPINNDCHMTKPKIKVSESLANVYELFLQKMSSS